MHTNKLFPRRVPHNAEWLPVFPAVRCAEVVMISYGSQLVGNALVQLILLCHSALVKRLRQQISHLTQEPICKHDSCRVGDFIGMCMQTWRYSTFSLIKMTCNNQPNVDVFLTCFYKHILWHNDVIASIWQAQSSNDGSYQWNVGVTP